MISKEKIKSKLIHDCLNCHKPLTEEELDRNAEKLANKVTMDLDCRYAAFCDDCQKLRDEGKLELFKGLGEDDE